MLVGKIFAMGDIHGNLLAFNQCMERSEFNAESDTLIQLGDVSDRYPDTAKVVEKLLALSNLIAIRGNHDEWTMHWINTGQIDPKWLHHGGNQTIESYSLTTDEIDIERHRKFFSEIQQDYYIDNEQRIFVHGGFSDPRGPDYDMSDSGCRWDRELWVEALNGQKIQKKPALLTGFKEIYIGHTPNIEVVCRGTDECVQCLELGYRCRNHR